MFQDRAKLTQTLLAYNFTLGKGKADSKDRSESGTAFFKNGFRVSVVSSHVLPDRILQIVSFPNSTTEPDRAAQQFLSMIVDILHRDMNIVTEIIQACRVVFHSIVKSDKDISAILTSINDLSSISLLENYAVHKNPFKVLQLTEKIGSKLEHEEWRDIRISPFNKNAYVATIFYESLNLKYVMQFLKNARNFVLTLINDIESVVH
ncbi:MAG: hypothetical protein QXU32_11280 [Nitrososphaerales archaeon]